MMTRISLFQHHFYLSEPNLFVCDDNIFFRNIANDKKILLLVSKSHTLDCQHQLLLLRMAGLAYSRMQRQ